MIPDFFLKPQQIQVVQPLETDAGTLLAVRPSGELSEHPIAALRVDFYSPLDPDPRPLLFGLTGGYVGELVSSERAVLLAPFYELRVDLAYLFESERSSNKGDILAHSTGAMFLRTTFGQGSAAACLVAAGRFQAGKCYTDVGPLTFVGRPKVLRVGSSV